MRLADCCRRRLTVSCPRRSPPRAPLPPCAPPPCRRSLLDSPPMPSGRPGAVRTGTETEIPERSAHLLRLQRDGERGATDLTPAPLPQGWRCPGPSPAPAAQADQLLVSSCRKIPQTAAAEPPSRRRWASLSPCSCCCCWACLPGRSLKSMPTPHAASEHRPLPLQASLPFPCSLPHTSHLRSSHLPH